MLKIIILVLVCLSGSACAMGSISNVGIEKELRREQKITLLEITELSSNLYCNNSSECQSVPIGDKACGGPLRHQPYSTLIGKEKESRLKVLSKTSFDIDRELNKLLSLVSNCSYINAPSLSCQSNTCIKKAE